MSSDAPVQIGQLLAGKYRVDRVLGQGGMGVVVAATHTQLDQKVAVKFLLAEAAQNSQATARFLREARASVKIHSEFVARVIDVGTMEETGTPYMVMEYLEGADLEHVVEKQGPLPIDEAVEYLLHACAALAEAHSHGIVHRDLKPANLFRVVRSDGAPIVKVLDFGISKMTLGLDGVDSANLTGTAAMLGTPMYMSPEQIRSSRDVDARTDIWSLGSILQELLTGEQPFPAESMPQLFAAILEAQPTPLGNYRADVPAALQAVVLRCLCKRPDERYATVAELAAALAPFASARSAHLAERVSRILGVKSPPAATLATGTPSSAQDVSGVALGATVSAQTGGAWEKAQPDGKGRKFVVVWSVAAAVLGLGVLGAVVTLSRGGEVAPTAEPDPRAAAGAALGTPPAAPVPVASAVATVPPAPPPVVAPSLAVAPPPATSATAVEPAPAPVAPTRPVVPQRSAPRTAKAPAAAPPPPKPTRANPLDIELK